ncbi:hypothetical protein [Prochlorococcus sp. MIT 1341]|nr:hypothetical protein [Prochlorococcus sp. MIT 1341]
MTRELSELKTFLNGYDRGGHDRGGHDRDRDLCVFHQWERLRL